MRAPTPTELETHARSPEAITDAHRREVGILRRRINDLEQALTDAGVPIPNLDLGRPVFDMSRFR